jgi:uncharacterized Ntn-hydrolase superfamily protein
MANDSSRNQESGGKRSMRQVRLLICFMMLALAMVFYPVRSSLSTWSIVAVDPATGDVGVATATCLDLHIDALAVLVPGKGAATTRDFGITDMGTLNAPWLVISVVKPKFGPNPIIELRERYDVWRQTVELMPSIEPQAKLATTWGNIKESQFGFARQTQLGR